MAFPMPINVNNPQADAFKRKFAHMAGVSIQDAIGIAKKNAIEQRKRQDISNKLRLYGNPALLREACCVPADIDALASLPSFQPASRVSCQTLVADMHENGQPLLEPSQVRHICVQRICCSLKSVWRRRRLLGNGEIGTNRSAHEKHCPSFCRHRCSPQNPRHRPRPFAITPAHLAQTSMYSV